MFPAIEDLLFVAFFGLVIFLLSSFGIVDLVVESLLGLALGGFLLLSSAQSGHFPFEHDADKK